MGPCSQDHSGALADSSGWGPRQRELERQRKHLQVVTGPLTDFGNGPAAAAAAAAAAPASAAGAEDAAAGQGAQAGGAEGGLAHRFFQSEGEEMPAGFAESPTEPAEEPGVAADRLWREAGHQTFRSTVQGSHIVGCAHLAAVWSVLGRQKMLASFTVSPVELAEGREWAVTWLWIKVQLTLLGSRMCGAERGT